MLSLYLASLALGGVMLAASFLGGDGHDAGHDGDLQAGHDHDASPAHAHDATGQHAGHAGLLPFLSLRFWIFALTFFGLTGSIFSGLHLAGALATGLIAGLVGVGTGWSTARLLQKLTQKPVGLLPPAESHIGSEGRLLLPVAVGQRGKIRIEARGQQIDLLAETESSEGMPVGRSALIVGLRGNVALVEPTPQSEQASAEADILARSLQKEKSS